MSIIALLTGSLFGTIAAIFSLFFIGVDWSTGAAVYFATSTIIALPLIGLGTLNRHKNKGGPHLSDWEREFHQYQPSAVKAATISDVSDGFNRDRDAA